MVVFRECGGLQAKCLGFACTQSTWVLAVNTDRPKGLLAASPLFTQQDRGQVDAARTEPVKNPQTSQLGGVCSDVSQSNECRGNLRRNEVGFRE